jgi:L-alanine-DL-glutamate epimerase-like enolase superfamily enzyme
LLFYIHKSQARLILLTFMKISTHQLTLKKRFPLAISRGVRYDSVNVLVRIEENGVVAWGEGAPGASEGAATPEYLQVELERFIETGVKGYSIKALQLRAIEMNVAPCAYAALDMALWDLIAKKANMPLYKLLGYGKPTAPTSITIGINPPEVVAERVPILMESHPTIKGLKIKLGSPEGVEADKAMFQQVVKSAASYGLKLRVDANGGWSLNTAKHMLAWLAEFGVEYVEQPLVEGAEDELPELFKNRALPIFVDESCRFASNIHKYAHFVDGVNLKLMKCGGITEALNIMSVAESYGLDTMIGCMSESSVSIAAGAALTGGINHVDLDSHYNLDPDPATGAPMVEGITMPTDNPGHGATLKSEFYA